MRPRRDDVEPSGARRELREAADSFCGGAGGAASADVDGVEAPKGPRGSSTASSLVDCVPYCRRRGPRLAGERGAAEALGAEPSFSVFDGVCESVFWVLSGANVAAFCAGLDCDCEGTSAWYQRLELLRLQSQDVLPPHGELPSSPRSIGEIDSSEELLVVVSKWECYVVVRKAWRGYDMPSPRGARSSSFSAYITLGTTFTAHVFLGEMICACAIRYHNQHVLVR
jgi:hypothetical protein